MLALFTSILTACGGTNNNQEQPEDVIYEPADFDQNDQRNMNDQRDRNNQGQNNGQNNGENIVPDIEDPLDRDEEEPDLGEEPSEERNNNNRN